MVVRKKLGRAVLSAVIAGSVCSGVPALAAENASAASVQQAQFEEVNVTIDGVLQHFPQSAILYKGSTMVPMRGVFEALGAELYWSGRFQTVKAIKGLTVVRLSVGDSKVSINGRSPRGAWKKYGGGRFRVPA
ncbi:hypothetical protein PRECH8_28440 [Insulibacter thermoxylanivorax]|uniref:Copper amine oxidase-like N-terminal domain-containing protein n=1 Tax=Insulibacter thermoxylanivorax TaxID=2749268 RepID=A0A916VH03_9BACL|nr:copper amine oxidase N-terminal domain-containing protein [Insulibacter thermoxylanivorax]GFR39548.1 hypothetical protein PRECH8_28440 [Insulibacter thermoxylanivorax]